MWLQHFRCRHPSDNSRGFVGEGGGGGGGGEEGVEYKSTTGTYCLFWSIKDDSMAVQPVDLEQVWVGVIVWYTTQNKGNRFVIEDIKNYNILFYILPKKKAAAFKLGISNQLYFLNS